MKIGVISPEFPPEIGGIQTYAYEFVRELARRGHGVTVFTHRHEEGEISLPGVIVAPTLTHRRRVDRTTLRNWAFDVWHVMNAAYAWIALETSPVIISVHGNDFLAPYLPVAQPAFPRLPLLWRFSRFGTTLEQGLGQYLTRRLVRRSLPRAAHILANSQYTERALLAKHPACVGITSVALVGVSREYLAYPVTRAATGRLKLITVCRLADSRKNVDLVLRALSRLKDRYAFSYVVVGDGPLRPDLVSLSKNLGLEKRVRFTGFVDHQSLRSLLADSDLFVLTSSAHPTSHEGFGIAYLEANACGTPVLAAKVAGAQEAVADGVSGYFVDRPSIESLTEALERFLSGKVILDPLACKRFARKFDWAKVVDCALEVYPTRPAIAMSSQIGTA